MQRHSAHDFLPYYSLAARNLNNEGAASLQLLKFFFLIFIIYNNLNKRKPTIATFIDVAKAFDTVDHPTLLQKIYEYGIRGSALDLIKGRRY